MEGIARDLFLLQGNYGHKSDKIAPHHPALASGSLAEPESGLLEMRIILDKLDGLPLNSGVPG